MAHFRCIRDCWSQAFLQYFTAGTEWEFEEGDDFPRKHFINLDEGEQEAYALAEIPLEPSLNKKTFEWLKKKYPESAKSLDFRNIPKQGHKRELILKIMADEGLIKPVHGKDGYTLSEHMQRERDAKTGDSLTNG